MRPVIIIEPMPVAHGERPKFLVKRVKNTMRPRPGWVLSEAEAQKLIDSDSIDVIIDLPRTASLTRRTNGGPPR